ncbi:MAG: DNA polymerase III subunit gamma/tau [Bacteroidota bacterium]
MSNFVVSARKYRPGRFEDVVGQEHVTLTLKNALRNDHLAHAFLFCGPRGVGKTTCARILAKTLNCQDITEDFEPCNTCESCKAFNENASFNITELDAASNNSVEHIRALIEQVRFQPQQGKYKVFIIDEVHMLSSQAFNAFLKTLEEPPSYAIFILATTEKHKILPTILSRCQIFDFRRIQVPRMVEHLQAICAEENIEAADDALHIVGQKADGALRDALSIFDRIVSFSGNKITYEDVINSLNVLDYDYYFKIVDAFLTEDRISIMNLFNEINNNGFEPDIFLVGLAEHLRNLLVCKDAATLQLLEVSDNLKVRYQQQAQLTSASFIMTALNLASDCDVHYKMARNKRLLVEMTLLKMTYINRAIELSQQAPATEKKKITDKPVEVAPTAPAPLVAQSTAPTPVAPTNQPQPVAVEKAAPVSEVQPETSEASVVPEIIEAVTEVTSPSPDSPTTVAEPPLSSYESLTPISPSTAPIEKEKPQVEIPSASPPKKSKLRRSSKHSLISLKNINAITQEIKDEEQMEVEVGELTIEKVWEYWENYIKQVNSSSTQSVLRNAVLSIEGDHIIAKVGSKLAESLIRQERTLLEQLRSKFNRPSLAVKIRTDETLVQKSDAPKRKRVLTPKEKYAQMLAVNPVIKDLVDRFELVVDE